MAAARFLEVAVVLSAIDRMSSTVRSATGNAAAGYNQLASSKERADAALSSGLKMGAGAAAGIAVLNKFADAYGEAQEASLDLASSMLRPGGILDQGLIDRINQFAITMSGKYAGAQKDYIEMVRIMKQNRIKPEDVLGGIGEPVAQLAELFKMPPGQIGLFASRMRNDMRVSVQDMGTMVDLLARLHNAGIGTTGAEATTELTEFYAKAGLASSTLGATGVNNARDLGILGGLMISRGFSGSTSGTAIANILANIADPKKRKKMDEETSKLGLRLKFFDGQGQFLGYPNMTAQLGLIGKYSPEKQAAILDAMGARKGLALNITKQLAMFGTEDVEAYNHAVSDQGDIVAKVHKQQEGYNQQLRIMHAQLDNLTATIGKSYAPAMTSLAQSTGEWAGGMTKFFGGHQTLAATAAGIVGVSSAVLGLAAAYSLAKAAWLYSNFGGMFLGLSRVIGLTGGIRALTGAMEAMTYAALRMGGANVVKALGAVSGVAALGVGGLYLASKGAQSQGVDLFKGGIAGAPGNAVQAFSRYLNEMYSKFKPQNGNTAPVTYAPVFNFSGQVDAANTKTIGDQINTYFFGLVQKHEDDKNRASFTPKK